MGRGQRRFCGLTPNSQQCIICIKLKSLICIIGKGFFEWVSAIKRLYHQCFKWWDSGFAPLNKNREGSLHKVVKFNREDKAAE